MKKFTLIEIIAVIAVLGILCALVLPNVSNKKEIAMVTQVKNNISNIQTAMDMYSYENNGEYASIMQPTLEEPQMVSFDMLYPKYLKSLPENVLLEYYWVDFMGKVWSSTVDAPTNVFNSDKSFEWNTNNEVSYYNIYKITNKKIMGAANNKVSLKKTVVNHKDIDKFITKTDENLLISSIDKFGLETAPVGVSYRGVPEDWFTPILNKEGSFEFTITSEELMYWDSFSKKEKKPEGTSITYEFSVLNSNGEYIEFTEDFNSLKPSTGIIIRITMKGSNGKLPSLMDFRLYYHFAYEETLYKKPERVVSGEEVVDIVELNPGESIDFIKFPNVVNPSYEFSSDGSKYEKIDSLVDIPKTGGYIKITSNTPSSSSSNSVSNLPIVKVTDEVQLVQDVEKPYISKDDSVLIPSKPNDSAVTEAGWSTVQEVVFVASASDGQLAHWISAEIKDRQPENTRILYRYATGNGFSWGYFVDDFSKLSDSRMLKVYCILQVKKEFVSKVDNPEVLNIRINSSKGIIDLNTVKPTAVIVPKKDNNGNRDVISTGSKIEWTYEAFDPKGKKITEVVWGGDKRDNYDTPGTYIVTLKLKNELNYWSDEIKYKFEVKDETPVAVIGPTDKEYFSSRFPVELTTTSSYDPDGDKIIKVEWGGDYKENKMYSPGTYTVKMRVQDEEENWSNWTEKTFTTIDSIFSGIGVDALDNNDSTYVTILNNKTQYVTWEGDLTNRIVTLYFKIDSQNSGTNFVFQILDDKDNVLLFENADTNGVLDNVTVSYYSNIKINIVIPENATKFKFKTPTNGTGKIFTIMDYPDKTLPSSVKNITSSSTKSSITLNWDIPVDEDFSKVAIFRDNKFIAYSTSNTYTDTPLYSNTKYTYSIQSIDKIGNRGEKIEFVASTIKTDIVWYGLDPAAFDDNDSTYTRTKIGATDYVTWNGDLANRVVNLYFRINSNYDTSTLLFEILDNNGDVLSFENANTNEILNKIQFKSNGSININIIMPENAVKLKFKTPIDGYIHVFTIKDFPNKDIPDSVTNITSTSTKSSIKLNWTNPVDENFSKVAVFRDNKFIAYSTTGTYTDTPLYSNTKYTYSLQSIDKTGNRGEKIEYTAMTIKPEILWSGLEPAAFDDDDKTYVQLSAGTKYVTWEGDMNNKVVNINISSNSTWGSEYISFKILDSNGNTLPFIKASDSTILTEWVIGYGYSNGGSMVIVVPEGATKFEFKVVGNKVNCYGYIYSIQDYTDKTIPNPVSFVSTESSDTNITLKWTNPTDEDFSKVAVYRDGVIVGHSATGIFIDTPLYANKEYNYELRAIDTTGNRSKGIKLTAKTIKPEILWNGTSPSIFDRNDTTYLEMKYGTKQYITWDGNLIGKKVYVSLSSVSDWSSKYIMFRILDESGNEIPFIRVSNGLTMTQWKVGYGLGKGPIEIIVPDGAVKFEISTTNVSGLTGYINDIHVVD